MKKILFILLGLIVLGAGLFAFFREKKEINVLVFSKTESFRHASIEQGNLAILAMGKQHGFTVDTTEDASFFQEGTLKQYNVVVFLNTTGDVLDEAQQLEFNRFIQAGGGYVGIHAAADTEYDWAWYGQLAGAYFNGHPNDPNVRQGTIQRIDSTHISTSHLPDSWTREDEWYNYKDINPDIQVLLNLDESSYEGGTNGENHPIAWYHDFDGGRAWYTGLGHTPESFADPLFLDHLWGGIQYAAGPGKPVDFNNASVAPEENRFSKVVLEEGLFEPMELELLPDGRVLFVERRGAIKLTDPSTKETTVVHELAVHSGHEDGLLGLALDPSYETNHWIYLFYSPQGDDPKQHVSRFVFENDQLDLASEKILLEIPTQREECCHSAGSLEFGPHGHLFISTGDNTNPHASDGYSPSDEQEGRGPWDAQKSSANMNDLRGKILRITPMTDGTYSIPDGNLFAKDGSEGKPEIYVMGCRNPFRIAIDQRTGYLYWGDVGPDAGEAAEGRGPAGHDEVNQARKAGFFGWPYFIGNNKPYTEYEFASKTSLKEHNPEKPINNSPNNTGAQELPPAQSAFIWYPYSESKEFPLVGNGGRNAMAGQVFYLDAYPESDKRFPKYYNKKLFTYDWMRGWFMAVTMDEEGNFVRMERFLPGMTFNNAVDMLFSPDGDIFMLEYGTNWFAQNDDARLVHLQYVAGNRVPLAKIDVDKTVGAVPLTLAFDGGNSVDFDGDSLIYRWTFTGTEVQSTDKKPTFTFEKAGTYTVHLQVKDEAGEVSNASTEILVGNDPPTVDWQITGNQSFYWDNQTISYGVEVQDSEDGTIGGGIDPEDVTVTIDYLERGWDHNVIAQGHQAMVEASANVVGKQLIGQSDCMACHQMDQKSVGPTYLQIADKYAKDPNAIEYLAQKIIAGGGGVWGDIMMAAHPQLSTSEAEQMSKYILGLGASAMKQAGLPLKGSYTFTDHIGKGEEGSYILTASYSDKGGQEIGPLTVQKMKTLRHPKIAAANLSENLGAMKFEVTPDMAPPGMTITEAFEMVIGTKGASVVYAGIDLTGIGAIELGGGAISAFMDGGWVDIRIDDAEGQLLGSVEIETSMSFDITGKTFQVSLEPVEGKHDVYLVFRGADDSQKPVVALVSLEFLRAENL
ncbi:MAG: ThuA domain-containing protein [Bacteroidota bacterium]